MEVNTAEEVCRAVALDLRARKLTHEEAGKIIGKTRIAISNLISRKKLFSRYYADLFAEKFGYSRDYLLYGKGSLIENDDSIENKQKQQEWLQDPQTFNTLLDIAGAFIKLSGNNNLVQAWMSFTMRDYDRFQYYLERTQEEMGTKLEMPADSLNRLIYEYIHSAPLLVNVELSGSEVVNK